MKIEFDNEPVCGDNDKHIKTKIKIYAGSMITNFHSKKIPKEKAPYKCLSIIMLDSEKIKMGNLMDDDLEKSSSDESDNDSNDETKFDNDESHEQFVKS